jgi:hypothetical protein
MRVCPEPLMHILLAQEQHDSIKFNTADEGTVEKLTDSTLSTSTPVPWLTETRIEKRRGAEWRMKLTMTIV